MAGSSSEGYSGSPINGQSFAKSGIADGPPSGQLGGYSVPGGWYNAVQIQATAVGDSNAGDHRLPEGLGSHSDPKH